MRPEEEIRERVSKLVEWALEDPEPNTEPNTKEIPFTVTEARNVAKFSTIDVYYKKLILWLCDELEPKVDPEPIEKLPGDDIGPVANKTNEIIDRFNEIAHQAGNSG